MTYHGRAWWGLSRTIDTSLIPRLLGDAVIHESKRCARLAFVVADVSCVARSHFKVTATFVESVKGTKGDR